MAVLFSKVLADSLEGWPVRDRKRLVGMGKQGFVRCGIATKDLARACSQHSRRRCPSNGFSMYCLIVGVMFKYCSFAIGR